MKYKLANENIHVTAHISEFIPSISVFAEKYGKGTKSWKGCILAVFGYRFFIQDDLVLVLYLYSPKKLIGTPIYPFFSCSSTSIGAVHGLTIENIKT